VTWIAIYMLVGTMLMWLLCLVPSPDGEFDAIPETGDEWLMFAVLVTVWPLTVCLLLLAPVERK
jgi:hypothetical protein